MFIELSLYDDNEKCFFPVLYQPCCIERVRGNNVLITNINSSVSDVLVKDVSTFDYDSLLRAIYSNYSFDLSSYHTVYVSSDDLFNF